MQERIGTCIYCGQNQMVRVPEECEKGEIDREATKLCTCEEAQGFKKIEQSIDVAEIAIENEYESDPEVQKILLAAVRPVGEHLMDKISVTHGRCRYVITRKNDGTLKLEKTTTTKEVKET